MLIRINTYKIKNSGDINLDIDKINELNQEISYCKHISSINPPCSRDSSAAPLIMSPLKTQKLLLISRDPSKIANSNKTLLGWDNTFYRQHVLPIFFKDYDKNKAKVDRSYFDSHSDNFSQLVYWTHYSKCYPGINKSGGHNPAKNFCSTLYLMREIEAVSPDYIILMGKDVIEFIMKDSALNSIKNNEKNYLEMKEGKIPVICLTHPSNANNKCKNDPKYRFSEMIQSIHELIAGYCN